MKRLTRTAARTLSAFLESPGRWRYGYELMREADISSGTLYPLLGRLGNDGWLESRWEESDLPGRPPRQLYRLTLLGRAQAAEAMQRARPSWLDSPRVQEA